MTQDSEPQRSVPVPTRKRPGRRWWRFFMQFSLRSLLLMTTLAAVGCWWFLQPATREEELAGKHLKLRRQVKLIPREEGADISDPNAVSDAFMIQNTGDWRLLDEHGDPLVVGRYQNDVPHGQWTVYHVNGRKAAQGKMVRGAKSGLWRVWDADGRLQSEVTYQAVERKTGGGSVGAVRPFVTGPIPVVGAMFPGGLSGGCGFGGPTGTTTSGPYGRPAPPASQVVSERHGPARVWHPNSKLKFEGQYAHDRKDGRWTYYDEQGNVTAQGQYRRDQKEGVWKERQSATNGRGFVAAEIEYMAGRSRAAHENLVAQLRAAVTDRSPASERHDTIARWIAAVDRLESLGRHGVPVLLEALDEPDTDLTVMAVRALERIAARAAAEQPAQPLDVAPLLAKVEPLIAGDDLRVRMHALLIVYRQRTEQRQGLLPKLLEAVQSTTDPAWQLHAFRSIVELDPQRQAVIFSGLAAAADPYLHPAPANQTGPWFEADSHGFIALATELESLPELLVEQSRARDPAVRRFVVAVVGDLTIRQQPATVALPGGQTQTQFPIPGPYRELIERFKHDPDTSVQEAAGRVGQPRGGFGSGWGCVF